MWINHKFQRARYPGLLGMGKLGGLDAASCEALLALIWNYNSNRLVPWGRHE